MYILLVLFVYLCEFYHKFIRLYNLVAFGHNGGTPTCFFGPFGVGICACAMGTNSLLLLRVPQTLRYKL